MHMELYFYLLIYVLIGMIVMMVIIKIMFKENDVINSITSREQPLDKHNG